MNSTSEEDHLELDPKEIRRRLDIAHAVNEEMKRVSAPFITAIARPVKWDEGDFIGSGSFMVLGGQVFLVTAMHVAMDALLKAKGGATFSNGHNHPYQLVTEPFCIDASLDIALTPVTLKPKHSSNRQACPSTSISQEAGPLQDWLFVHGFPEKRSRFLKMDHHIHSSTLPYGTVAATPSWSDFDPDLHFAISFDPTSAQHSDGSVAELPDPHGMSGSAVWNTRRSEVGEKWQPSDARIVGVIHRWDQNARCLIGTRIEHIHRMVALS